MEERQLWERSVSLRLVGISIAALVMLVGVRSMGYLEGFMAGLRQK